MLSNMNAFAAAYSERFRDLAEATSSDSIAQADAIAEILSDLFDEFGYSVSSPGISALTCANGSISEFNAWLAELYGAKAARVGVSGSSMSNLAVIGFLLPKLNASRDLIVCDRHSHRSIFGGVIASGKRVVTLAPDHDLDSGLSLPPKLSDIETALEQNAGRVSALCLTSPTYEGVIAELDSIKAVCQTYGVLLVIDSAWGSLMGIVPGFPGSHIQHADIVVVSPHKSGLAPCQVSIVLFSDAANARNFDRVCELGLATTSPNQLLLMIAEHRYVRAVSRSGALAWQHTAKQVKNLKHKLRQLDDRLVIPDEASFERLLINPVQIAINTHNAGIDASKWAHALQSQFAIDVEYAAHDLMALLFGQGSASHIDELLRCMASTKSQAMTPQTSILPQPLRSENSKSIDMRSAYYAPSSMAKLNTSVGQEAAQFMTTYPPGRPELLPGEEITKQVCEFFSDDGIECSVTARRTKSNMPVRVSTVQPISLLLSQKIEYANFFREIFSNPPFDHFAYDKTEAGKPVSARELIHETACSTKDYMGLKQLDAIQLPTGYARWMDPAVSLIRTHERCQDDGYFTAARTQLDGKLVAVLHARVTTLRRLFETEEWQDPQLFSTLTPRRSLRSRTDFFDKCKFHLGLAPNSTVMTISCMAIHPSHRGDTGLLYEMFASMSHELAEDHRIVPMLAEIPDQGAARVIDSALNERLIYGLLPDGHDVVFSQSISSVLKKIDAGRSGFVRAIKEQVRRDKQIYIKHWSDHEHLEVRDVGQRGKGVFATQFIPSGSQIAEFRGERYRSSSASSLPSVMVDHAIQVGPDVFIHNARGLAELINHSCEPNAGISGLTKITAVRNIEAGEEIVWDYRCSEDSDWVMESCSCGASRCEGRIGGYASLGAEQKQEYLSRGMLSDWIVSKYCLRVA